MRKWSLRHLVAIILLGLVPTLVFAISAEPGKFTIRQGDGTTFEAQKWGDEWSHGIETADGYTIAYNNDLQAWTFAALDPKGALVATDRVVGVHTPPDGLTRKLRPAGEYSHAARAMRAQQDQGPQRVVNPVGTGLIPIVLMNFSDTTKTFNPSDFNTLLFGTGSFTMNDFYKEISYNKFSVSAGPAGVKGWYTAAQNHDYYGGNNSSDDDTWPGDLVYEAAQAADPSVNFAPYDTDGDCLVDVIGVVHQGGGEEISGAPATNIWSHRWKISWAQSFSRSHYGAYITNDPCVAGGNVRIDDYVIMPETYGTGLTTMGVFAHEYGHALGLIDLYDTDGSSEGIGDWSLMAGGSWNRLTRGGDRPAHMDAYSKAKLGWVVPTVVTGTLTNQAIRRVSTTSESFKLLSGNEYFLVENRQKDGFDIGLPGAGLLIYHIDESQAKNDKECYPTGPLCSAQHLKVAIVQADSLYHLEKKNNQGDTGDPYPGSTNNTSFTNTSAPNSNIYNDTDSGVRVTAISASANTMTATLATTGGGGGGGGGGGDVTIFSDNFEGSLSGWAYGYASSGSPVRTNWGKVTCKSKDGAGSLWCAAGGDLPKTPCSTYADNMGAFIVYGPFNLADATAASAEFDLWFKTESDSDYAKWLISINGSSFSGYQTSGTNQSNPGWDHITFNFADVTSFTAVGAAQVWFAFVFSSDSSINNEGAFVDNLVIKKKTATSSCAYSLAPTSQSFTASAGTGNFGVTTNTGCAWSATASNSWIHITSGSSGTGSGAVMFSVDANSGTARNGSISVQGQTFSISQAAGGGGTTYAYSYWIPVAVNGLGVNSYWKSDLGLFGRGSGTSGAELRLYRLVTPGNTEVVLHTTPVSVTGGKQMILTDVVGQAMALSGKGAMEIRSNQPLLVNSRTYNWTTTATFGQDYDGYPAGSGFVAGQIAYLTQLTQNPTYRTNIGITNTGLVAANVTVTLFDANGTQLTAYDVPLNPGVFWQEESYKKRLGRNDLDACYATVRVNSGSGLLIHASVTDNRTSDPTTFWARP